MKMFKNFKKRIALILFFVTRSNKKVLGIFCNKVPNTDPCSLKIFSHLSFFLSFFETLVKIHTLTIYLSDFSYSCFPFIYLFIYYKITVFLSEKYYPFLNSTPSNQMKIISFRSFIAVSLGFNMNS